MNSSSFASSHSAITALDQVLMKTVVLSENESRIDDDDDEDDDEDDDDEDYVLPEKASNSIKRRTTKKKIPISDDNLTTRDDQSTKSQFPAKRKRVAWDLTNLNVSDDSGK